MSSAHTNCLPRLVKQRELLEDNLHTFTQNLKIVRPEFYARLETAIATTQGELDSNSAQLQVAVSQLTKGGAA